jgi:hypothetical protein
MSFDELADGAFPDYPVSGAPNFVSGPNSGPCYALLVRAFGATRAAMVLRSLPMTMPCKNEDGAPSKQCGATDNTLWCCY